MAEQAAIGAFFKGWDEHQESLVQALAPLSTEQLALRAAPHLRTVRALASHIAATRVSWLHTGLGGADDTDLESFIHWGLNEDTPRDTSELIEGLRKTWQLVDSVLSRLTFADLDRTVESAHGGKRYTIPVQWVVWHVLEHDLHHGGQLLLTLGVHNIPAPRVSDIRGHLTEIS